MIDNVGYYSLECWGGATFDVCLRFLRENPWERLRLIKSKAKKTPLQMLLRGQNLVGYRNYADDVVDRFVALACENGMDIFRVFDALNDTRNIEAAVRAVKKHGGHAQGTLCYTISPVHTIKKFVQYAREQVAIGIDSLCIKDMAGILSPISRREARERAYQGSRRSDPAPLPCVKRHGRRRPTWKACARAPAPSTAPSRPWPGRQPAAGGDHGGDIFGNRLPCRPGPRRHAQGAPVFRGPVPGRATRTRPCMFCIDPQILIHQIPGGMISNFRSQLSQQGALDKLRSALDRSAKVREDLGWPPLVTPTSQIVGTQAVMNVLAGERYKIVPNEVKDYFRGLYGRAPAKVNPNLAKKILGDETPITVRPGDTIAPMLPKATEGIDPKYIKNEEDIISYCILPEPSLEYFKWRDLPQDARPEIPADAAYKKLMADAQKRAAPPQGPAPKEPEAATLDQILHPEDYKGLSEILAHGGRPAAR